MSLDSASIPPSDLLAIPLFILLSALPSVLPLHSRVSPGVSLPQ